MRKKVCRSECGTCNQPVIRSKHAFTDGDCVWCGAKDPRYERPTPLGEAWSDFVFAIRNKGEANVIPPGSVLDVAWQRLKKAHERC